MSIIKKFKIYGKNGFKIIIVDEKSYDFFGTKESEDSIKILHNKMKMLKKQP